MPVKDQATLNAEFADNTTGAITAADARDIIDTLFARAPMSLPWDVPVRTLASGASTSLVHGTDYLLKVNKTTGSATAVNLPASPAQGWRFEIKDGKGDADVNNITITPASGTIDGQSNYVINTQRGSVVLTYDNAEWTAT